MSQTHSFSLEETLALVRQKEVRKPISQESILRNWKTASAQRHDEIELVRYKQDVVDDTQGIESFLKSLKFSKIEPQNR